MKNTLFSKAFGMIIVAVLVVLPSLSLASTYSYVDQANVVRTVVADTPMIALNIAPNIGIHSGVALFNFQTTSGVLYWATPPISNVGVDVGKNSAVVSWNTSAPTQGKVYYSTSPLSTYEGINYVTVSGASVMTDSNYHSSQSVEVQGLLSDTTYYYLVYNTDQVGNVSVSWPSTFRTSN